MKAKSFFSARIYPYKWLRQIVAAGKLLTHDLRLTAPSNIKQPVKLSVCTLTYLISIHFIYKIYFVPNRES